MHQTIRDTLKELNASEDLSESIQSIALKLSQLFQVDTVKIFFVDDGKREYVLVASTEVDGEETLGRVRLKFGQGVVGYVAEREEPVNLADATAHPDYHFSAQVHDSKYRGFLAVPLIKQGDLLGVIMLQRTEEGEFTEDDEALLMTLAIQLVNEMASADVQQTILELSRKKRLPSRLEGIASSPGVGIGRAVIVYPHADLDAVPERPAESIEVEIDAFKEALEAARKDIEVLADRAKRDLSVTEQVLFDAYLRILDSRTLMEEIISKIQEDNVWAQFAVKTVVKAHIAQFESLDDPYMRERAVDFKDLGHRILAHLQGGEAHQVHYPKRTILVSNEITATALMEVPEGCLVGVVSSSGSSNSHVAILTRALGIPAVLGVEDRPMETLQARPLIVDGYNGKVYVSPGNVIKKEFKALIEEEKDFDGELARLRDLPAETTDHHKVDLYVNTGLMADGGSALSVGSEGVGLYRTELPFMVRNRFPSEEEQRVMYRQLLTTFAPKRVVMRTLDIGGDKSLPYFSIHEDNPFLGWRGVRISLDHPQIFLQQMRAMLQASEDFDNLALMFPMISSLKEVDDALAFLQQAYEEVVEEGFRIKKPPVGLMVEVPAAVYQAKALAKKVDFLSVGSNDLVQYLLAVDRNNPKVADIYNPFHPAVLHALKQVVDAGHKARKPVSICGELAGDPLAVPLLIAMGFDSLSMNARALPRIKWVVRNFSLSDAKKLLKAVLKMDDANEIKAFMEEALDKAGLGTLIRAGN